MYAGMCEQGGLRQGVGAILLMNESEPRHFAKAQADIGCHPNWAGYLLNGGVRTEPFHTETLTRAGMPLSQQLLATSYGPGR